MKKYNTIEFLGMLNKIFDYNDKDIEMPKKPFLITDPTNVCGVYGRNKEIKKILLRFVEDSESNIKPSAKLDYTGKQELGSKFLQEYFKRIMDIFDFLDESPTIYSRKDYPIKLESESIGFILAPRIEE